MRCHISEVPLYLARGRAEVVSCEPHIRPVNARALLLDPADHVRRSPDPLLRADVAVVPAKVDIRLPGEGNSKSHGARPVY